MYLWGMSGKKITKETAIKSMLTDLKKGIDKVVTLGKFGKKWEIPKSTYYRWYEEAVKLHKPYLDKIQEIENKTIEKVVSEIVTSNILSKIERQQILSDIARGNQKIWKEAVSKEGVVKLESFDPLRYIDLLNKMDGAYALEEKPADEVKPITFRIIQSNEND